MFDHGNGQIDFARLQKSFGFGYALEQALNVRQPPQFLGSVIPIPNGGFCTGHQRGRAHLPHGKIF